MRARGVKNIGSIHDIFSLPQKLSYFLSFRLTFPPLFTFSVEEAFSYRRDCLPKSISSKHKLDHPNLIKVARYHP
jgi:hypothetical protein